MVRIRLSLNYIMIPCNTSPHVIRQIALEHVPSWQFAEVSQVSWSKQFNRGGLWYPPYKENLARIEMGWEENGDVMWHEFFHSVYHYSPMNKSPNNWWSESFCNAFSEVNRQCFYKRRYTIEEADCCKDDKHLRTYIIPCIIILHHIEFDATRFKEFWISINELAKNDSTFDVSNILGYSPSDGSFKYHKTGLASL